MIRPCPTQVFFMRNLGEDYNKGIQQVATRISDLNNKFSTGGVTIILIFLHPALLRGNCKKSFSKQSLNMTRPTGWKENHCRGNRFGYSVGNGQKT